MNRLLPLLYACLALAALLSTAGIVLYWMGTGDPNRWEQTEYEFKHSDAWLTKCLPQEVRMEWSDESDWIYKVTIDFQEKTISGSSGNGISFSGPFALVAGPNLGPNLTDDKIQLVRLTIAQLANAEGLTTSEPDYSHDFRLSYYASGTLHVRHYPANQMPPPLVQLGTALQLKFPLQH